MEDPIFLYQETREQFINCWYYWNEFASSSEFTFASAEDQSLGDSLAEL